MYHHVKLFGYLPTTHLFFFPFFHCLFLSIHLYFLPSPYMQFTVLCSFLLTCPYFYHIQRPKKKPAGLSQKILYYRFPRKHKSIPTNPLFEHILIGAQNILDGKFFNLLVFGMSCTHHTANNPICELQNHRMKETSRWKKPLWINKSNL